MIKKYLFIVFTLLIPFVSVNGFAFSVDLSLFTGGLSLLDSLFLIALGLVLIGILFLCIAFLKPEKALAPDDDTAAEDKSDGSAGMNEEEVSETAAEETEKSADTEESEKAADAKDSERTSGIEEKVEENDEDEADADEDEPEDSAAPETETELEPEPEKPIEKITITLTGVKSGELKILPVTDSALVGRSMKNDVVISDSTVSGVHCEFIYRDGKTYLRDRNSTNGTYLNSKRIFDNTEVHKGDILTIGQSEFKIGI